MDEVRAGRQFPVRRVTGNEVARVAGVSQSTVSIVFSGKWQGRVSEQTATRVLRTAERMGYQPNLAARGLRTGSTRTVVMVIPVLSNPFFASVHTAVVREAARHGIGVVVYPLDADDEKTPFPATRQVVDGILACSVDPDRITEMVGALPLVVLDSTPPDGVCVVNADIAGGATLAVDHIAALGHRRVVHVAADRTTWTFRQRATTFDAVCGARNLTATRVTTRLSIEDGYRAALTLLRGQDRPSAVVCDNDQLAVGVYWAARELGLELPEDLSVVGFDDTPMASVMSPQLTTVRIQPAALGKLGMRALVTELGGERADSTVLPATLAVRGSTAEPRPRRD